MTHQIRIDVNGIQVQIQPEVDKTDPKTRVQYVFLKDRETGQTVRVARGSSAMTEYIHLIVVENGHGMWQIPVCSVCDGDGVVEYRDTGNAPHTKPCYECLGYGIGVKEAA